VEREGQLVTAIHDEGGGLILCKGQAQDYDRTLSSHGCFGLAGTDHNSYCDCVHLLCNLYRDGLEYPSSEF
jgi:hypothetical protein